MARNHQVTHSEPSATAAVPGNAGASFDRRCVPAAGIVVQLTAPVATPCVRQRRTAAPEGAAATGRRYCSHSAAADGEVPVPEVVVDPPVLAAEVGPRVLAAEVGPRVLAAEVGPRVLAAEVVPRVLAAVVGPRVLAAVVGPRVLMLVVGQRVGQVKTGSCALWVVSNRRLLTMDANLHDCRRHCNKSDFKLRGTM